MNPNRFYILKPKQRNELVMLLPKKLEIKEMTVDMESTPVTKPQYTANKESNLIAPYKLPPSSNAIPSTPRSSSSAQLMSHKDLLSLSQTECLRLLHYLSPIQKVDVLRQLDEILVTIQKAADEKCDLLARASDIDESNKKFCLDRVKFDMVQKRLYEAQIDLLQHEIHLNGGIPSFYCFSSCL